MCSCEIQTRLNLGGELLLKRIAVSSHHKHLLARGRESAKKSGNGKLVEFEFAFGGRRRTKIKANSPHDPRKTGERGKKCRKNSSAIKMFNCRGHIY